MKEQILEDMEKKLSSHFEYKGNNYSIYKKNDVEYNFIAEDVVTIKDRFRKFASLSEVFDYLDEI